MTWGTIGIVLRGAGWPAIAGFTACAGAVGGFSVVLLHLSVGLPLLATAFALLAAASAYALEEPASVIVDVTPTSPARHTAIRAAALIVPLVGGLVLVGAIALRNAALSTTGLGLALAGNLLLGFAVAVVARSWTGEPGVWAASMAALMLIAPVMIGPVARWVHTVPNPSSSAAGLSSDVVWAIAAAACGVAIVGALRRDRSSWA
jgi:hypothetical protein